MHKPHLRAYSPTAAYGRWLSCPSWSFPLTDVATAPAAFGSRHLLVWIGIRGSLPGILMCLATYLWYLPSRLLLGLERARPSHSAWHTATCEARMCRAVGFAARGRFFSLLPSHLDLPLPHLALVLRVWYAHFLSLIYSSPA